MFEVLVVLFVIWLMVTLVGHLSWVVVRSVFNLLTEDSPSTRAPAGRPPVATSGGDPGVASIRRQADADRRGVPVDVAGKEVAEKDVAAFFRVLDRLVEQGQVKAAEGNRLASRVRHLSGRRGDEPAGVAVAGHARPSDSADRSTPDIPESAPLSVDRVAETEEAIEAAEGGAAAPGDPSGQRQDPLAGPIAVSTADPLADPDGKGTDAIGSVASGSSRGSGRTLSGAELIRSFLAAHNIRWGELVAGTLIVVCSIGLVVSLWSTLTSKHRVIPSLIFMGGTASIFAAGLYTLSRWRLRHTSRAVLVIATLLVPLSVLAGLAAAGRSVDAVSLDDALTWFAIVAGAAVYGYCLWRGGRALVGQYHALPLAASVAGPSFLLPWMPAVSRWRPDLAGWCIGVGAVVLAAAFVGDARVGKRFGRRLGRVSGRNRVLTLVVGTFAYAAVVGYLGFLLREVGADAWRAISLASIPAAVALAGACESISRRTKWGTLAVATTTAGIVSYAAAWLMLVPSMAGPGWVWMWGGLMTVSGCVVGWAVRRDLWIVVSTVPLTMAALITSPNWMGGVAWAELPLWRRLIGGEPMAVAVAASVIAAILGEAFRSDFGAFRRGFGAYRRGFEDRMSPGESGLSDHETVGSARSAELPASDPRGGADRGFGTGTEWLRVGWGGVAVSIAAVLAFGPVDWRGVVWELTPLAVLFAGYGVAVVRSAGDRRWMAVALPASGVAWFALVRALGMAWPPREFDALPWMGIAFGFAASTLGSAVSLRRLPRLRRMRPRELAGTLAIGRRAAVFASVVGCVVAAWGLPEQWRVVAGGLAVAAGLSVWAAAGRYAAGRFALAQGLSFLAVAVAAWGRFGEHLVTRSSWRTGVAPWAWCVVFAAMPVAWFLVRESLRWGTRRVGPSDPSRLSDSSGLSDPSGLSDSSGLGDSVGSGARRVAIARHFAPLTRPPRSDSLASCALDRWVTILASASLLVASALWFLGLVFDVVAIDRSPWITREAGVGLITLATVAVGLVAVWWGRLTEPSAERFAGGTDERRRIGLIVNSIAVAVSIWGTVEFFSWVTSDPAWRVIGATSTLFVACGLLTWTGFVGAIGLFRAEGSTAAGSDGGSARRSMDAASRRFGGEGDVSRLAYLPIVAAAGVFGVSSVGLLTTGWFGRLIAGDPVDLPSTWAVAVWWTIASVGLLFASRRQPAAVGEGISATLLPLACLVVTPAVADVGVPVWVQAGCIGSAIWLGLNRWLEGRFGEAESGVPWEPIAVQTSRVWLQVIGIGTALSVIAIYLVPSWDSPRRFADVVGPVGLIASVLAVLWWQRFTWLAFTVLAGQIVWLGSRIGGVDATGGTEAAAAALAVLGVWIAAAIGSTASFSRRHVAADYWHVAADYWHAAILAVVIPAIAATISAVDVFATIGPLSISARLLASLVALSAGGIVLTFAARREALNGSIRRSIRRSIGPFGWGVVLGGVSWLLASSSREVTVWAVVAVWLTSWVVVWRIGCADRRDESGRGRMSRLPDGMASAALWLIVAATAARTAAIGIGPVPSLWAWDLTLVCYAVCVLAVVATGVRRAGRGDVWLVTLGLILVTIAILSGRLSVEWTSDRQLRLAAMLMTAGFGLAVWTRGLRGLGRIADRFGGAREVTDAGVTDAGLITPAVRATWVWALLLSAVTSIVTIGWMSEGSDAGLTRLTILVVALSAWSVVELAVGVSGSTPGGAARRLQRTAVSLGLLTMALMASVGGGEPVHPWLEGAMRWLVAATVAILTLVVILPRAVGRRFADPWRESLTLGAVASAFAAIGSIVVMFAWEWRLRAAEEGIPGLSVPMVFGVAVTLGALSVIAGGVAVFGWSRPDHPSRPLIVVEDRYRRWSVWGAQAFAALTWLHVYLCRPDIAFVGLREYWPLVVMALSFVSVGVTEWARRRGDRVLAETLRQTAVYLPMIPVLGFWLSGSSHDAVWRFVGGRVPYELLLAVGAIYYGLLSAMWKGVLPRVSAIVLANAAWWVVLVQTPGWAFMGHPQAWLIPPAACVLVVTHLSRDRLTPASASAIRYAAMLVIYVSSTADMLIADVGETLAGPVVLILLALVGMAAGVVLGVKPFLYLGSAFVFVGVTSMVWHAQQAIDQTWPWWAFGITLGMILLAGLMTLEKNRPRLRELAERMASWEA